MWHEGLKIKKLSKVHYINKASKVRTFFPSPNALKSKKEGFDCRCQICGSISVRLTYHMSDIMDMLRVNHAHYNCIIFFRPKHPTKVHVWAGISRRGATQICIFDGIMDAPMYTNILDQTLLPFIEKVYPDAHRLMQDNDPKHTSKSAKEFFTNNRVNWWKTPPESPDLNPIENLWHELKEFIRREVKPTVKEELVEGILQFWRSVDMAKCNILTTSTKCYQKLRSFKGVLLAIDSTCCLIFNLCIFY